MATQITQIDQPERNRTVLRIEGDMLSDDARLIEKIANCTSTETGHTITIDLADLSFMDSDAASVLRRLKEMNQIEIEGVELFLQSAVNMAERS
jgi:anti-anti-sigma factor